MFSSMIILNYLKILTVFLAATLVLSCSYSTADGTPDFERRHPDEFYTTTGVLQYFLPARPLWARHARSIHCQQSLEVEFLDLKNFRSSLGLDYPQSLHFQHDFTILKRKRLKQVQAQRMDFRDRERLFYDVFDRVQSDIYLMQVPRFHRIHFVWIDPLIDNNENLQRFHRWMNSEMMNQGHPIAISFCLNRDELAQFKERHRFDSSFRAMSYEFLSPYTSDNILRGHLSIQLEDFFHDKEIHLFLPRNTDRPLEIKGNMTIHHY